MRDAEPTSKNVRSTSVIGTGSMRKTSAKKRWVRTSRGGCRTVLRRKGALGGLLEWGEFGTLPALLRRERRELV